MRPVQKFTDDYLRQCARMSPDEIARFLDDFMRLHAAPRMPGSKLISLKVPHHLLGAFKAKARLEGKPYQTQIKVLMAQWVSGE
jgi:predicted DNA binding CopG/RHH family protein